MQIGDRVYDKQINANGYILDIDDNAGEIEVQYFWGFHSNMWPPRTRAMWHTKTTDKRRWAHKDDIIVTPMPTIKRNKVAVFGRMILNTRMKLIAELPAYIYGDIADIVIRYGKRPDAYHMNPDTLVLNHNLTINKWDQCQKLGDLVPAVLAHPHDVMDDSDIDWIVKPFFSVGGRGIENWDGNNHHGKYLQRRLTKDREFRAHCFLWADDKVPLIQEKKIADKSQLCWNMKKGGSFHQLHEPAININKLEIEMVDRITKMSIDALKRLKYDLGGVDLALDDNGELFILEVNSYSGMREMTFGGVKGALWDLWNLDIDEYKATRWEAVYPPIVEQIAPVTTLEAEQEVVEAKWEAEMVSDTINPDGTPTVPLSLEQRAAATMVLKGCLSELESKVTDEERKAMLEAGRAVAFNYSGRRD